MARCPPSVVPRSPCAGQQSDGCLAGGVVADLQCAGWIVVDGGVRGVDVGGCLVEEAVGEVAAWLHAIEVTAGEELLDVSVPSAIRSSLIRFVVAGEHCEMGA